MFEATARLKVRPGELEGFTEQAAEFVGKVKAGPTPPLRYDWFLSEDGTECEVREAYPDADALLAQQQAIGQAKAAFFDGYVAGHEMTFYGELSPPLAQALNQMGASYKQLTFFQGL